MAGKLAPSLKGLFAAIDFLWPRRNHGIDGWYRPSDPFPGHPPGHNGYSHAIDVDVRGIDPAWIINHIYRNSSVMYYIIWHKQVWSTRTGWDGHPYKVPPGGSSHYDHMHIEIYQTNTAEQFGGPWFGSAGGGYNAGLEEAPAPSGGISAGLEPADPRDYRDAVYSSADHAQGAADSVWGSANSFAQIRQL